MIRYPEKVMGSRSVGDQQEVLLAWKGMPADETTWEEIGRIRHLYPDFHLEDKVVLRGGGNDMNQNRWGKVYRRKSKESKVQGV